MSILPPRPTAAAVRSTRVNSLVKTSSPEIQKESKKIVAREATEGAPALKNIRRDKRELLVDTPYDFHTTHLFCDFDMRGRHRLIPYMPNHCIWVWNNKYVHEGFYRLYKMYQLEAFSFGQYALRLFQIEYENYQPDLPKGA
ncbi:GL16815 [Drosophila persimilis]|uniref:GL16815 n=2 Tax=Drosophila persimilis TaxID=7234 RepID=B4GI67_DROPE|nr:GL16815 [Drosophila persimilis]